VIGARSSGRQTRVAGHKKRSSAKQRRVAAHRKRSSAKQRSAADVLRRSKSGSLRRPVCHSRRVDESSRTGRLEQPRPVMLKPDDWKSNVQASPSLTRSGTVVGGRPTKSVGRSKPEMRRVDESSRTGRLEQPRPVMLKPDGR